MKFTAVLVALVAAVAAPLASAQCSASNQLLLGNLTITSTIKRTSVKGGARIVQSITVKNNNAASVVVGVGSAYNTNNTVAKGTARVKGTKTITLQVLPATSGPPALPARVTSGPTTGITIPTGQTLKATIVYKAPKCVNPSPTNFAFGPAAVALFADPTNCIKTANAITVRSQHSVHGLDTTSYVWDGASLTSNYSPLFF